MRIRGSVAIDLGTVNTLVWVAGRGIVLEEPSAIAVDTSTGSVVAIGTAADVLADKEPQDIRVIYPLRDGVVADLDATAEMLQAFLNKAHARGGPMRPRALVCGRRLVRHVGRAPLDHGGPGAAAVPATRCSSSTSRSPQPLARKEPGPERGAGRLHHRRRRRDYRGRGRGRLAGGPRLVAADGGQRDGRRHHEHRAGAPRPHPQQARRPAAQDDPRADRRRHRLDGDGGH